MKGKIYCEIVLFAYVLVATFVVTPILSVTSVSALSFPQIEFCYNGKSYMWDLSKMEEESVCGGAVTHNAVFDLQMQYLQVQKVGMRNYAEELKRKGVADKQILFSVLPNFACVYAKMSRDIEREFAEAGISFNPNAVQGEMFNFSSGQVGVKINDAKLLSDVLAGKTQIEISVRETKPQFSAGELKKSTAKRSCQSTSFAGSEEGRRFNLKKAMQTFNGLVVMPNEEVSFNKVLNSRDNGEPYKEAMIILNGVFTKGLGGGICQASTTIYNAVLMAGLDVLEVHRHTLPVGYVEKGFDAMVNDCGVDMRFRNNTELPIYIKTYADEVNVFAEVYGESLGDVWYKKVSEKVRDIEPEEPQIIADENGKYISRIKYKGEFFTEKYAKKGYEVKGYLYTYSGNEVKSIKLVRHEKYASTRAIIYEGVESREDVEVEKNQSEE